MTTLRKTSDFCPECATSHAAEVIIRANQVLGIVDCPIEKREHVISSDAGMYLALNKKSCFRPLDLPRNTLKCMLNYISITNACNFHCAVCAADSGGEKKTFLSIEEIMRRAGDAKSRGAKTIRLFGGEPTIHPELHEIIRRLARMGFHVWMVSNGYLLGKNRDLASELRACGLKGVCLQFDSLQTGALDLLCRNYLDEKSQAIRNLLSAGLSLGFNCTTTTKNLPELAALLKKEISLGANVKNVVFGSAAPVGRFEISPEDSVDREQIIASFLNDAGQTYFTFEDVFPLPTYLPWGAHIHPDCGAHVVLIRMPGQVKPLNHYIDMQKLYCSMGNNRANPNLFNAKIMPGYYVLRSIRKAKRWSCLKLILALLFRRKTYSLLNVAFTDYRGKRFLDEERIENCAAAFHTSVGPVSACLHFYQDARKPGSLAYEAAHGSC